MPPRTTAAAKKADAPASEPRAAAPRKTRAAAAPPAEVAGTTSTGRTITRGQTFAEHTGARPFPVLADSDEQLNTRSFQLPIGVVERIRATADGIQHRTYETLLEGEVPDSISGLVVEAFNAIATYYEDLLNNGQPFRRVRKLPPGARPTGAARGAAKRAGIAAEKRAKKDAAAE
jgi:hypothetical protein